MKIPQSIRDVYDRQKEVNSRIEEAVTNLLRSRKEHAWHYECRLKAPESFALKVESGRFPDLGRLEDFFACTLVVQNQTAISRAEKLIRELFDVRYRRPSSDKFTHKRSDSFVFDDLRLYVSIKQEPILPPSELSDVIFEVQIKTYLQHAWSIATHDLIYKSDSVSWAKERIAYQIKATLEHAELSIAKAEELASSALLPRHHQDHDELETIIRFLSESWSFQDLPADLRRLALNVNGLIKALNITFAELKETIKNETDVGRGTKTLNLSPYGIIVQSLLNQRFDKLKQLAQSESADVRVVFPREIDVPSDFADLDAKNVIIIN